MSSRSSAHAAAASGREHAPDATTAPFPFIVARGRSGTTLLRAMFDSHPDMAVPPESHFLVTMGLRRRRHERGRGLEADRFVRDLMKEYGFRRWALDPETVRVRLIETQAATYAQAMREVFTLYAERHGKTRYAEKTPMNVMHIPFLARAFPEARFIHMIRDGRDVALSYLDTDFGVDSLGESAIYWRRFVRKGRRDGRRLGGRYREIRYEDLLSDPEAVLRSLCTFVELPYDPVMLTYHRQADRDPRDDPAPRASRETPSPAHPRTPRLADADGRGEPRALRGPRRRPPRPGGLRTRCGVDPASIRVSAVGVRIATLARRLQRRAAKGLRGLRPTPRRRSPSQQPSAAAESAVPTRRSP